MSSSENTMHKEVDHTNQNENENSHVPVVNPAENSDLPSTPTTVATRNDTQHISKSAIKTFSRFLPRNVVGTIGRKTSLLTRHTLRSARSSLKTMNQGWETISAMAPSDDGSQNSQQGVIKKRNQQQINLHKNYTLKLSKLKEKFKTKRNTKRDRFGTVQSPSHDRFRKDLNKSMVGSSKQAKLLEKLLEKHNKHLESL